MGQLINLDEVYNVLLDNTDRLSKTMQQELSYICDLRSNDDYYVFADLIRDRKSKSNWVLMENNNAIIMPLDNPNKELKVSVYKILNDSNIIQNNIDLSKLVVVD